MCWVISGVTPVVLTGAPCVRSPTGGMKTEDVVQPPSAVQSFPPAFLVDPSPAAPRCWPRYWSTECEDQNFFMKFAFYYFVGLSLFVSLSISFL